jgi:protein TonB
MFQESLLESAGAPNLRRSWTTLASTVVQAALLATAALIPILRPDVLPQPEWTVPIVGPGRSPEQPVRTQVNASAGSRATMSSSELLAPLRVPQHITNSNDLGPEAPSAPLGWPHAGRGGQDIPGAIPLPEARVLPPPVPTPHPRPIVLSQGVTEGFLISAPKPAYPQAARIAHIQGEVELRAVISRGGEIEQLEVVSGNPLLVTAAVDAVRRWRYRPYLLNGSPTAVETEVRVRFVLSAE